MSSHQALHLRSLVRALEVSDGPEQLAAELQLSALDLQLMMDGVAKVPEEIFLRAIDLLVDRGIAELTERGLTSARSLWLSRQCQAKALANAVANLPATKRVHESRFKWLPIDALERLTPEQKETYLLQLTKQLGLHS